MIGKTILHYEILGQTCLPQGTIGKGGICSRSCYIFNLGEIL